MCVRVCVHDENTDLDDDFLAGAKVCFQSVQIFGILIQINHYSMRLINYNVFQRLRQLTYIIIQK